MLGSQPDSQRLGKDCGTVTILTSRRRATVLNHVPGRGSDSAQSRFISGWVAAAGDAVVNIVRKVSRNLAALSTNGRDAVAME